MYKIKFKPSALKELNGLNNKDIKKIIEKIAEVLGISSKFLLEGDLSVLNYETKYSL